MKEGKKPTILLLGDYSNFHATLARGLRAIGCNVTLASDGGSFMKLERDIDISRRFKNKAGGLLHALNLRFSIWPKLQGYDIVSFRDPQFLELRPERIIWFFNKIISSNSSCFLSYLSTDVKFLDMLEAPDSPLKYSEWFVNGNPNRLYTEGGSLWKDWHSPQMKELNDIFYSKVKGAVTALYEYHCSAKRMFSEDKIAYGGIPIDLDALEPQVFDRPKKMRLFIARDFRRKLEKGNDFLETAARNVISKYPDKAELVVMENVSRSKYLEMMRSCHLLLDQIYSYTPATMALEAMASGLTAITGAEQDFYDFIGEKENFPIINAPHDLPALEKCIEEIILNPDRLHENSIRGREFVMKHNSKEVVAGRFLNFWMKNA